jgi:hypothetical protein
MSKSLLATALAVCLCACSTATMGPHPATGGGDASGGGSGGGSPSGTENCTNGVDDDGDGFVDCADPDCFSNTACFTTCVDLCVDGSAICDTAGVRTCVKDATSGCRAFGPAQACTNGLVCSGGTCVATCSDQCTLGNKTCSNTGGVVECQTLGTGCTDWVGPTMCMNNDVCSGGMCVAHGMCTNQCTSGATRCTAGGQQQTCVQQATGCTDWSFPTACTAGNTCAAPATSCQPIPHCTQSQVRCAATTPAVETCDMNGNWVQTQACPQACNMGMCTANATCTPGAVRCNTNDVEMCNSSGSAWLFHQSCNVGCNGGLCTDPCTSGATRCNGSTPETCNMAGTAWTAGTACPNGCWLGACMQADLVVDGVTQTLEGDLAFKNDVVIKNGGSLKVGATGQLIIHASHITIDAASNINGNDVGTETRGSGSTGACTYGSCSIGTATSSSSYGTQGTSNTVSTYCGYPYYTTEYCSFPASSIYDRDDDLSISQGSKFVMTKGGGLVKLVANAVSLDGQITANATGASASGGGIFIAADSITGTGAIQATGNTGGGQGRVKLLRGSTNGFTGSVSGKQASSPMPPLDLVSGSHPDPTRWYNDGLGDWFLAWSKPYPTLNGYYYKLSTDPSTVPSQMNGNGTFYQQESYVVKAKDLTPGTNYFHIVSVDSAFNVGTVKATGSMQLNATPPTVMSSSHPQQRTWYQNNALYFTWTNPQDDANFTGFYYVLDQHADTVPSPVATSFTTNKQVLLANTADGIWVFHLVNRDTRGAITKAARHYVVYVGTAPMTENLSGSVFDASNNSAPLSGVTLSINGGLFSTTSTSSGTYTFGGSLYVGHWEVTASKDGYLPQTKAIDLVAGMPLNENFTLMKTQ